MLCVIPTQAMADTKSALEIKSACAALAAKFANADISNVDVWLTRYRSTFNGCMPPNTVEATPQIIPKMASVEKRPVEKAKHRIVEKIKRKMVVKAIHVPRPALKARKPHAKRPTGEIDVILTRTAPRTSPENQIYFPVSAPKTTTGASESWLNNCSPKFGSSNRESDFYISNTGKRMSCFWGKN